MKRVLDKMTQDDLVEKLRNTTAGAIAGKNLCAIDCGAYYTDLNPDVTLGVSLKAFSKEPVSFALYQNVRKRFAVVAVVYKGRYIKPGEMTPEIMDAFFPRESRGKSIHPAHIQKYNKGRGVYPLS